MERRHVGFQFLDAGVDGLDQLVDWGHAG